jgi:hypothetical protein
MIFDVQNQFAHKTVLPTAVATAVVGDVIDLWAGASASPNASLPQGVNGPIGGPGTALTGRLNEIEVYVQVTTAINSGGTATLQFKLVVADNAALTTNPVVLAETPVTTVTDATIFPAGTVLKLTGDIGNVGNKQYLGITETVGTAVLTAGAVSAGIVTDFQTLH